MGMGSYLRERRESRGLSQRQLASLLGVDPTYLCHVERGRKRFLGKKLMAKIVSHLNLTEDEQHTLQDLREIAVGKLAVPTGITSETADILKALAGASRHMTDRELVITRILVKLLSGQASDKHMMETTSMQ